MKYKTYLFRCDSSYAMGMGHLKRSIVLAKRLAGPDVNILFAAFEYNDLHQSEVRNAGFQFEALSDNSPELLAYRVNHHQANLLFIDHSELHYDFEYQFSQHSPCKIFVIEDLYHRHYCHFLLNHNISSAPERYNGLVPEYCKVFAGPAYTLISPKIQKIRAQYQNHKLQDQDHLGIFVAMGATDPKQLIPVIVKRLIAITDLPIHVATTSNNQEIKALSQRCKRLSQVYLHLDHPNIFELIAQSNLAIVTASSILIEVMYLTKPFIGINAFDNQTNFSEFLKKESLPLLHYTKLNELANFVPTILASREKHTSMIKAYSELMGSKLNEIHDTIN